MEEENRTKRKAARAAVSFAAVGVLLVVMIFISVNVGSLKVSFPELSRGLFLEPSDEVTAIYDLRFRGS